MESTRGLGKRTTTIIRVLRRRLRTTGDTPLVVRRRLAFVRSRCHEGLVYGGEEVLSHGVDRRLHRRRLHTLELLLDCATERYESFA